MIYNKKSGQLCFFLIVLIKNIPFPWQGAQKLSSSRKLLFEIMVSIPLIIERNKMNSKKSILENNNLHKKKKILDNYVF